MTVLAASSDIASFDEENEHMNVACIFLAVIPIAYLLLRQVDRDVDRDLDRVEAVLRLEEESDAGSS